MALVQCCCMQIAHAEHLPPYSPLSSSRMQKLLHPGSTRCSIKQLEPLAWTCIKRAFWQHKSSHCIAMASGALPMHAVENCKQKNT